MLGRILQGRFYLEEICFIIYLIHITIRFHQQVLLHMNLHTEFSRFYFINMIELNIKNLKQMHFLDFTWH